MPFESKFAKMAQMAATVAGSRPLDTRPPTVMTNRTVAPPVGSALGLGPEPLLAHAGLVAYTNDPSKQSVPAGTTDSGDGWPLVQM